MRIFLLFISLLFSFSVNSDEITDFEIEGFSIGDSLLDYYSQEKIDSALVTNYPGSNKFKELSILTEDGSKYFQMGFGIKNNDSMYIIHSLSGYIKFSNKIDQCLNQKENTIKEIENIFNENIEPYEYTYTYENIGDGKNYAYITDYKLSSGSIRIFCNEWSDFTKSLDTYTLHDSFTVGFNTSEYIDFLNNEAYKN